MRVHLHLWNSDFPWCFKGIDISERELYVQPIDHLKISLGEICAGIFDHVFRVAPSSESQNRISMQGWKGGVLCRC